MILTLLFLLLLVVNIIAYRIVQKKSYKGIYSLIDFLSLLFAIISSAALCICIIITIVSHVGVDAQIRVNELQYQSLVERNEVINSDYEDISKSDVIKDIAEWNKYVYGVKYWGYNPWTSWFYSKQVVDELKYVE